MDVRLKISLEISLEIPNIILLEKGKPLPLEIVDHFTQLGIPVNELNSYYFRNADDYEIISNDISVETDKLLSEVKTVLGKDEQSALTLDDLKLEDYNDWTVQRCDSKIENICPFQQAQFCEVR